MKENGSVSQKCALTWFAQSPINKLHQQTLCSRGTRAMYMAELGGNSSFNTLVSMSLQFVCRYLCYYNFILEPGSLPMGGKQRR